MAGPVWDISPFSDLFLNQVSHTYDSFNQLVKSGNTDLAPSKSNIAKK